VAFIFGEPNMVSRIWRGWTALENAEAYEAHLKNEIFPAISNRRIAGYLGIYLLRRHLENEVEFVTIMWFDTMEAVRAFAGENYEIAIVSPQAKVLLARFDEFALHYQVKAEMKTAIAQSASAY
jgi:hypothetical protein